MFGSVPDFRSPVLLDRPGGLRNSRQTIMPITCFGRVVSVELREKARLAQCSTETPGRSALRGGSQGPKKTLQKRRSS